MLKSITSLQNPFIKNLISLGAKARERKEQGLFLAEGLREVELALRSGFEVTSVLFDDTITPLLRVQQLLADTQASSYMELIAVNTAIFEKIAYRSGVPNMVAVIKMRQIKACDLRLSEKPLLLVMESVEKPGNLGAMLRTADAAAADAVFVCDPHTDIFNPNAIRASLGAIFTVPVLALPSEEALAFFKIHGISVLATSLTASKSLYECDLCRPLAFVVGAEATGISTFWDLHADERVVIPMGGRVDSLNVSASAAIVLFEAVRQRSFA